MIFRVSLGKANGLEKGTKLAIYTRFLSTDPTTQVPRADERKVAEGKVTDYLGEDYAWIRVSNVEDANQIKGGDRVHAIYKDSFCKNIPFLNIVCDSPR